MAESREKPGEPSDADLVEAVRSGDRSAWSCLLGRYQHRLFSVCYRMVGDRERAGDLTQDAFVRIIQGFDSYDGRSRLSTWMIRVTMNVVLSHLRYEKHRRHLSLDVPDASGRPIGGNIPTGGEPPAGQGVQQEQTREQMARALLGLGDEQRAILVLRDVRGLEYEQIAEVLQVPVGTVKSRIFRARAALRRQIELTGPEKTE